MKEQFLILPRTEFVNHDVFQQVEGENGFLRKQWPKLWESDEYGKRTSEPDDQVTHFLGIENGVVISHVKVFKRSFRNI